MFFFVKLLDQCKLLNQQCNDLMISPLHILVTFNLLNILYFLLSNKYDFKYLNLQRLIMASRIH
jgi:hypothetical protein